MQIKKLNSLRRVIAIKLTRFVTGQIQKKIRKRMCLFRELMKYQHCIAENSFLNFAAEINIAKIRVYESGMRKISETALNNKKSMSL